MKLEMFPASDGDCLLLSCGDVPRTNILIDGGRSDGYALLKPRLDLIAAAGERLDLLVLTHIDADHIEGLLEFVEDTQRKVQIAEVWFNGFDQLKRIESFGFKHADRFSKALARSGLPINVSFGGDAIEVPPQGELPTRELPNDVKVTLLSPDRKRLDRLSDEWDDWRQSESIPEKVKVEAPSGLESLGRGPIGEINVDALADGRETIDRDTANGSSIAFIVEHHGKRALMAADAHPDLLVSSLRRLLPEGETRYRIDLMKVSHHGSKFNTNRSLASVMDCSRFAISTDGSRHGHPDPESLAKLIKLGPKASKTIYFNYRSAKTIPWDSPRLKEDWDYSCVFPQAGETVLNVEI
ncbi:MBL fold metallo-hydrolase [Bradyrhizobium brasilense]|uniref:ComEC/Rec2 family competence protein n=1 Tax=Bradyrhizobium brasilense TaxID=1419277 RepID=UPI0028775715|nr:MBL fold metallo-hydrolase [Bradyrhizobium brasilense]MCP3414233.1 MBL fold metallo-hydrolase [Bradyrhizobium brasilense]